MKFTNLALVGLLGAPLAAARFCIYFDQYHTVGIPGPDVTTGIDCVILAFAPSTTFSDGGNFQPFVPVSQVRSMFDPGTKVNIAIGGWGDTSGFSRGAQSDESRKQFAQNVANMLMSTGADGVDIDWEYPGGNGNDYRQNPNSGKVSEIDTFPMLLEEIRNAIGPDKQLSIAVPGLERDMIAFTPEKGPDIWKHADFVSIMAYDLENRRDTVTGHHTSVEGAKKSVNKYLSMGLDPAKANLGFAFYSKFFTTQPGANCAAQPLGCPLVLAENPDGTDALTSGALPFDKNSLIQPPPNAPGSSDGSCGPGVGTQCIGACCSSAGFCGFTPEHCGLSCLAGWGTCSGASASSSWLKAHNNGILDQEQGGEYFFDAQENLFWTWDTPQLIARKFDEIIKPLKLGGVMGWSLGEDTFDNSHIAAMKQGMQSME